MEGWSFLGNQVLPFVQFHSESEIHPPNSAIWGQFNPTKGILHYSHGSLEVLPCF